MLTILTAFCVLLVLTGGKGVPILLKGMQKQFDEHRDIFRGGPPSNGMPPVVYASISNEEASPSASKDEPIAGRRV